jgi:hypothetical protein
MEHEAVPAVKTNCLSWPLGFRLKLDRHVDIVTVIRNLSNILSNSVGAGTTQVRLIRGGSAAVNYRQEKYTHFGYLLQTTEAVRTGGATVQTTHSAGS